MSSATAPQSPLIGRDDLLEDLVALASTRPGAIVLWGEPGVGRRRLARELHARLAAGPIRVHVPSGPEPLQQRVESALEAAGLGHSLAAASRASQFVAVADDLAVDPDEAEGLARILDGSRGLVVVAATEVPATTAARHVPPLTPGLASRLVLSVEPGLATARIAEVCALADGLPRHIVALTRAAHAQGEDGAPLRLPPIVRSAVAEEIDTLDEVDAAILRFAALIGEPAEVEALAKLVERSEVETAARVDGLVGRGLLAPARGEDGSLRFDVRRALTRAALVSDMGPNELRSRHQALLAAGRAAGWRPARLAEHARGAGDVTSAVDLAVAGAEEARALHDMEEALRLATLAIDLWTPKQPEVTLARAYHASGMARIALFQYPEAASDLERASDGLRSGQDEGAALRAATSAALVDWNRNERRRGFRKLSAFLDRSSGDPSPERTEAILAASMLAGGASLNAELRALAIRARLEGGPSGVDRGESRGLALFGYARSALTGSLACLPYFVRARDLALRLDDIRTASITYLWRSHMLLCAGHVVEAKDVALEGLDLAREHRLNDHATVLVGNVGEAYTALGDLGEARGWLQRAAEGWKVLGAARPTAADAGLGWLLIAEGRIPEALTHFRELEDVGNVEGMIFHELAVIAAGHAVAAAEYGASDEARRIVERAVEVWRGTDDRMFAPPLLAAAAEAGPVQLAEEAVDHLVRMARQGVVAAPMYRDLAIGHVARQINPERAIAAYRAAAAGFDRHHLAWLAGRSEYLAGLAAGQTDEAAELLLSARGRFATMGSGLWRQRAEAALRAIGRRIPSRGTDPTARVDDLSSREIEVLQHLMLGLSNREIGERLYIAERTVARHLAAIFAKLGVSNRAAAVAAATDRGFTAADAIPA